MRARPLGLQPRRLQKRQDGSIELRIAVQNHVTVWTSVGEGLAQLLDDPLRTRMWSHVEVQNLATPVLDDKKAVEQLERYRRHGEEIERGDHLTVILEKGKPTPTRIGMTPRSPQVPSYGSFADHQAEFLQFGMNLGRSRRVEETRCTLDFPWLSFRACGPQDLMKICQC